MAPRRHVALFETSILPVAVPPSRFLATHDNDAFPVAPDNIARLPAITKHPVIQGRVFPTVGCQGAVRSCDSPSFIRGGEGAAEGGEGAEGAGLPAAAGGDEGTGGEAGDSSRPYSQS